MSNIGILGGSFNPPHKAHRAMAEAALKYGIDEIYFMPTALPPHKSARSYVSDPHRKRMVKLLIDSMDDERVHFSDYEMKRGGISYTYKTLEELKAEHKDDRLFFIIGGDSLNTFDTWRNPELIVSFASIIAFPREGMYFAELKDLCKKMSEKFDAEFIPLDLKDSYAGISSTDIRNRLRGGETESLTESLSRRVWKYILLHGLYGHEPLVYKWIPPEKDLKRCLKSTLRPKRYKHTLGVADTARMLGNLYSGDDSTLPSRAYIAGLLHDCAKYYTDKEQIELCDEYGIALTDTERANPALIHGKLGAYLAAHRYGVKDEEILSAIRLHTVGRPGMSTLEKIIYVADYIEPGRVIPGAIHPLFDLRRRVKHDLDGVLIDVIDNTIAYLKETGRVIDEASKETMHYYMENGE